MGNVSIRNYFDIAERARSFTAVAATGGWFDPSFMKGDLPMRVNGAFGSTELFRVLGVEPALGRGFTPDDGSNVVVVSHAFWRTHFADRPTIVGETMILDGDPMIVVGVMPEGFRAPMHLDADLWRHFPIRPVGQRRSRNMTVFGRLANGVDDRLATRDVESIAASLRAEYPAALSETSFGVRLLHEQVFGDSKRPLGILLAAAALLLFVGSVNLSSLLLARASVRRRELVVRLALGAGRGRIVRQLLTEGSLLVAIGGAIGLLLARWATSGLVALGPAVLRTRDIGIDGGVLLFCVGIMIITVPAVALLPAMRASRVRLAESLGDRSGVAQNRGHLLLRDGLVVAQLAVTVVMLAAGGALARSLATLHQTDPGFPSSGLVAAAITLPPAAFADASGSRGFFEEVAREVQALPGVAAAAMTSLLPFSGHYFTTGVRVEGRAYATDDYGEMVDRVIATPEYLSTLGIPVVHGRWLREGDRFDAPGVAIINTHLARRLFGTEDPLGRRIRLSFADSARTVVGVVGPVLMAALDEPPRGRGEEGDDPHRRAAPRTAQRVHFEDPAQQLRPAAAHVGRRGRHHVGGEHRGLRIDAGLAPAAAGPVGILRA